MQYKLHNYRFVILFLYSYLPTYSESKGIWKMLASYFVYVCEFNIF